MATPSSRVKNPSMMVLRDDDPHRRQPAMADTKKPAKSVTRKTSSGFTDEERAAMKEYAQELKTTARRGGRATAGEGESDLLARIAEMPEADRVMAERIHALVKDAAPELTPRTWYGMPAYAK